MTVAWTVTPPSVKLSVEATRILYRGLGTTVTQLDGLKLNADSVYALGIIKRFAAVTGAQDELDEIVAAICEHGSVTLKVEA